MSLINADQREHLKLLREHAPEVSIEICKLALDYLSNGSNVKKYQQTASKYNTTPTAVEDAIKALVMLLINVGRSDINDQGFVVSMNNGFTAEQISILWQFVSSKREFVSNILRNYGIRDYRFRELDWRLAARIASRSLLSQTIPIITIKLHLDTETINENKQTVYGVVDDGDRTSNNWSKKKEVIVQIDPNNLLYIIDVLERALDEAKSHRVRNLSKAF